MISVLYTIILITNFKLIEMCIKSSCRRGGKGVRLLVVLTVCTPPLYFPSVSDRWFGELAVYTPPLSGRSGGL